MNTINFSEIKELPKGLSKMVCDNVMIMRNTAEFHKALKAGSSIEMIVSQLLPFVEKGTVEEDVKELLDGIGDFYKSLDVEVDDNWLSAHMNEKLAHLPNIKRVRYLDGIISAEIAAYPDTVVEEELLQRLYELRDEEDCNDEDVKLVCSITEKVLDHHAGILARQSLITMEKYLKELDPAVIEEQIMNGKDWAISYAAACYVAQKCGYYTQDDSNTDIPARLIGAEAAANLEASKLMKMYSVGKITKVVFLGKIKKLFKTVLTFVGEHIVEAVALGLQGALIIYAFLFLLPLIGKLLYFSPILLLITTSVVAYLLGTKVVTTNDFVNMINTCIDIVKAGWECCKGLWHKFMAHISSTEEAEEEVDMFEDEEEEEDNMVFA